MRSVRILWPVALVVVLILTGCGGGSSSSLGPPPTPPPPALLISPTSLPSVVQGHPYTFTFQATGGKGALKWSSPDPLPSGLGLSSSGVLSGVPDMPGGYNFRVQVQDSSTPTQSNFQTETFYVVATLSLNNVAFPKANRGIGYQFPFFPTGGTAPYKFTVTAGSLPPGMAISSYGSSAGQMSGTPTQAGSFAFTLQIDDSGQGAALQTASASLNMVVTAILQITTSTLPNGIESRPYGGRLSSVNGTPPLRWSVPFVPQGLTFDPVAGSFSGTPTEAIASSFAINVTDSSSPPQSATGSIDWWIFGPLQFMQTNLGSIQVGFTGGLFPIFFTGGEPPVTSTLISGALPPGMTLDNAANLLDGAATQIGNYSIVVQLQDSATPPQTAQGTVTFTITPLLPVLANANLPTATINVPYSWGVTAKNGQSPFSWNVRSGSLPPGLTLDSLGLISGTPTSAGSYTFVLQVTDSFSPPDTTWSFVTVPVVSAPLGRNDSIATATSLTNGTYAASISPYTDQHSIASDGDFYKLTANPGSTVSVSILAKRLNPHTPLDSVVEILDSAGDRLTTCKDPTSAYLNPPLVPDPDPTDYNDACINDDDPNTQTSDSDLSLQVPGTVGGPALTIYVHVFEWRGDARPDLQYQIQISGAR
jgi:hypothetical protein